MNPNSFIRYFDLQSQNRGQAAAFAGSNLTVIPQYVALVLGIAVQPFLAEFQSTHKWSISIGEWSSWFVFAAIMGLLIFPAIYKSAFDPNQPRFVQFCTIFASGIGWKSLLTTAAKAGLGLQ